MTGIPMLCGYCGRPMLQQVWVGNVAYHPECTRGPSYSPMPSTPGCQPVKPLTEEDVRRIVCDELDKRSSGLTKGKEGNG